MPSEKSEFRQPPVVLVQPKHCNGCIWGTWEGSKQFCSKPNNMCVRGSKAKEGDKG